MLSGVLLASICQSVVLAGALVASTSKDLANRYLALTLAVLAGMMSVFVLGWTGRDEVPPWLAFLPVNLPLALGPALLGYVGGLVKGVALDRRHFIPGALQFAYLFALELAPGPMQTAWKIGEHDEIVKPVLEVAAVASLALYTAMGLGLLRDYRAWLAQQRSDADRYAALWIAWVMIALTVTTAALALVRLYTTFVGEIEGGSLYLWFGVLSCWLGIEGWRQSDRRFPKMVLAAEVAAAAPPGQDWRSLGTGWRQQIQAAGWWREPDLALATVARRLGTNTSYLSRGINEGLGLNFNELINRMRAEEVARRIEEKASEANFLELALEAGFSSKATFNRAFRAVHGVSPSDYRGRLKSQKSAGLQTSEARPAVPPVT